MAERRWVARLIGLVCLALGALLAGAGCARDPGTGQMGTPDAQTEDCVFRTTEAKAPLTVPTGELWSKPLMPNSTGVQGAVVEAAPGVLGVVVGSTLLILDASGAITAMWGNQAGRLSLSPPSADGQGTFYVAGQSLVAIDRTGTSRWSAPLGSASTMFSYNPPVVATDGHVYSLQKDGQLVSVRSSDGTVEWSVNVAPGLAPLDRGSIDIAPILDDTLVVAAGKYASVLLVNRHTGATRARLTPSPGLTGILPEVGVRGFGVMLTEFDRDQRRTMRVVTTDGRARWSTAPAGYIPATFARWVDLEGRLMVWAAHIPGGDLADRITARDCNGQVLEQRLVRGPMGQWFGSGFVLGADGTLYALTRPNSSDTAAGFFLVALDRDLHVLWTLPFMNAVPVAMGAHSPLVLSDAGVLYFVQQLPNGTGELVAVQTQSPGRAATPWSGSRFDNAGTGWAP